MTDKDILESIKEKIKVYREGGITSRQIIRDEEIDYLILEVERLRDGEPSLNGVSVRVYEKKFEELTKELDKYKNEGTGLSMVVRNRELEAENAELKEEVDWVRKNLRECQQLLIETGKRIENG